MAIVDLSASASFSATLSGSVSASASLSASVSGGAGARSFADPFTAFRFLVSFDQDDETVIGGFTEVSGLVAETEVETLREGGVNSTERQLAGPAKFPSRLVLKRGMADKRHLWAWYLQVMNGEIVRRDVRVQVLPNEGPQRMSWNFLQACPVKWTGPVLNAGTSAIAFESIELVHQGLLPF